MAVLKSALFGFLFVCGGIFGGDIDEEASISSLDTIYCDETSECEDDTLDATSVWCRGYKGCEGATITGTDGVNCMGLDGCKEGSVSTTSGVITCNGRTSCKSASITADTSEYLTCSGQAGCQSATISTDETNIFCFGYGSCQYAEIESVSGDIFCDGDLGCRYADVSSSDGNIYASGERALFYSSIDNTATIFVTGDQTLMYGEIRSNGVDNLNIYSSGDESLKYAELYCYDDSNCTVHCNDGTSCDDFNFFCEAEANCVVNCDGDCAECPEVTDWNSDTDGYMRSKRKFTKEQLIKEEKSGDKSHLAMVDIVENEDTANKDEIAHNHNLYVGNKIQSKLARQNNVHNNIVTKNSNNNNNNQFFLFTFLNAMQTNVFFGNYIVLFAVFVGFYSICTFLFSKAFECYSHTFANTQTEKQLKFQYQSI